MQQGPWRLLNALGMQQMTRVVISHTFGNRTERPAQGFLRQALGNVLHFGAEALGTGGKHRVAFEQVTISLQLRPTSGSVVHDHVDVVLLERRDITACQLPGLLAFASMHVQGAAANLVRWNP